MSDGKPQPVLDGHDVRDISNCSEEFLRALAEEPMMYNCLNPACQGGMIKTYFHPAGTRQVIELNHPCPACIGRGWIYGACAN